MIHIPASRPGLRTDGPLGLKSPCHDSAVAVMFVRFRLDRCPALGQIRRQFTLTLAPH